MTPRSVIGAVRSLRETRRATRYCVYGNSMCWLCTTGENNTMASSLSMIIITTIVKLCNLFDSVRAPRKLVSLLLFFFLSFLLSLSLLLSFSLPPPLPLCLFFFSSPVIRRILRRDPREEQVRRQRGMERKTSILKVTDICLPSENPASSPVLNRPNTLIGH